MKETLTTSDVAKMLGLHVNTLKNWARDGKLPSFRTVGGHYRIRAGELASSLRELGIPIPEALEKMTTKHVYVVNPAEDARAFIGEALEKIENVRVDCFNCGVDALLAMGARMPAAVVWDSSQNDVDPAGLLRSLKQAHVSPDVLVVITQNKDSEMVIDMPRELSNIPWFTYPDNLTEMADWIRRSVN